MTPDDITQLLGDLDHADRLADRVARIIRATPELIRLVDEQRSKLDWIASSQPVHPSSLTDALAVAEFETSEARDHVRALLTILDAIGGYRTVEQQDAVRAARESL